MLTSFRQFCDLLIGTKENHTAINKEQLHTAAAALMLEVATVDQKLDERELASVKKRLQEQLQLSEETSSSLMTLALEQQSQATSLYQFTRLINDHFSADAKYALMLDLWSVAYADLKIDKYEEYIIRRIAELIYVPHSDYIRAKIAVRDQTLGN